MITTRFYLDCRVAEGEAPLKLAIRKRGQGAFLPTGIRLLPSQWDDKAQRVTAHPQKGALNSFLTGLKFKVDNFIREMLLDGSAAPLTATQIKNIVAEHFDGKRESLLLHDYWFQVCAKLSPHSQGLYLCVWKLVCKYDRHAESRQLVSCNARWVSGFVAWMNEESGLNPNSRGTYLSRLKAVFASAVRDELISSDPTKGHKPTYAPTRRRNLSAAQIHTMMYAPARTESQRLAADFFSLSFFLRAANPADIVRLTPADIHNGRIDYTRAKTGSNYSVRIESEAQALIDKYTDGKHLFKIPIKYRSYESFLIAMDGFLKRRAAALGLPKVSLYWARHTFASLAFELGYGMDLVSAALGHSLGGAPITSVYVAVQDKQVDDLARAVYDSVLKPSVSPIIEGGTGR